MEPNTEHYRALNFLAVLLRHYRAEQLEEESWDLPERSELTVRSPAGILRSFPFVPDDVLHQLQSIGWIQLTANHMGASSRYVIRLTPTGWAVYRRGQERRPLDAS